MSHTEHRTTVYFRPIADLTCRGDGSHREGMTDTAPAFTWNDIVEAVDGSPDRLRPGSRAWVVGISAPNQRSGSYLAEYPAGYVYDIEFEDGSSVTAPEAQLRLASKDR